MPPPIARRALRPRRARVLRSQRRRRQLRVPRARRLLARATLVRLSRYVCDKGERIVDQVHKLEELPAFERAFGALIDEPGFRLPHENKGASLKPSQLEWEPDVLAEFVEAHAGEYELFDYQPPL